MRRFTCAIAVALAVVVVESAVVIDAKAASNRTAPVSPLGVGQTAPDFKLVDQNGKAVTLSAARGEKVVLVFYRGYW